MKKDAEDRVRKELGVATIQPVRLRAGDSLLLCIYIANVLFIFQSTGRSATSNLITGISAAAILEIRRTKARFLELCSQDEEEEGADTALKELGFLDFDLDEYSKEVGEEMLLVLREMVVHCREALIGLEVIRRLKSLADCFNAIWSEEEVKLACEIAEKAIRSPLRKRSKLYQSGMAALKDLSQYKTLKENKLYRVPLGTIKGLRGGKDDVDAPGPSPPKRPCLVEGEDDDDKYHQLMEDLANSTDPELSLSIESQIEEMGYEPNIQ